MAKGDESKLSQLFLKTLKNRSKQFKNIYIEEKIKIISDLTCLYSIDMTFEFLLGFSEVDIVFFEKIVFDKKIEFNKSSKGIESLFRAYNNKKNTKTLNIPFVILELKSGHLTTDAIRSRSVVAKNIKNIFPFCLYIFVCEKCSKKNETLMRQGKNFDAFFIFENEITYKDIINIYDKFIYQYIENKIKNL